MKQFLTQPQGSRDPNPGASESHGAESRRQPNTVHLVTHDESQPIQRVYLHAGQLHASATPCVVTTILGSCVAICLCDKLSGVGGVNHYLLPDSAASLSSPRFGRAAFPMLLDRLLKLGGRQATMEAKVFGGANVISAFQHRKDHLGVQNIQLAFELLAEAKIPVIAQDVGGEKGRKIIFNTHDGQVMLKRL